MQTIPHDLCDLLRHNTYPGRGIMLGNSANLEETIALYFIMGRSVNSRNRVFRREGDSVHIEIFDRALVKDPSLILYRPMLEAHGQLIVTNGDQTDTVYNALQRGGSFGAALRTRTFEPDAPHFTPRVSGMADVKSGDYSLSILKSADPLGNICQRFFFEYDAQAGRGHFIHTYQADGDPLPSFVGEPLCVAIPDDLETFTRDVWTSLNPNNRVALFLRRQDRDGRMTGLSIYNRHEA
jgi:IMP cyclohydrolase